MTHRQLLRIGFVAFLAIQLAIPVIALAGPRPTRFGWQMFTAYAPAPSAWVEWADGSFEAVDVEALLLHPRAEADLTGALVTRLCADASAVAVVVAWQTQWSRSGCP